MRASAVAIAFVAFLAAAGASWSLRRHVEDAELVAAAIALVCVAGAACTVLRRRFVAGLCTLLAGAGVWAATGGVDRWLLPRAPLYVGGPLVVALVSLVFASASRQERGAARRR